MTAMPTALAAYSPQSLLHAIEALSRRIETSADWLLTGRLMARRAHAVEEFVRRLGASEAPVPDLLDALAALDDLLTASGTPLIPEGVADLLCSLAPEGTPA